MDRCALGSLSAGEEGAQGRRPGLSLCRAQLRGHKYSDRWGCSSAFLRRVRARAHIWVNTSEPHLREFGLFSAPLCVANTSYLPCAGHRGDGRTREDRSRPTLRRVNWTGESRFLSKLRKPSGRNVRCQKQQGFLALQRIISLTRRVIWDTTLRHKF